MSVIDIKTRKPIEAIDTPDGETAQQFMRRWSRTIKDGKFNNIAIIVMDENNYCDYGILAKEKLDMALFCILLDDIREQMKESLFYESFYYEEE